VNPLQMLAVLLPAVYATSAALFAGAVDADRERAARWTLRAAIALHALDLVLRAMRVHEFPIVDLWTTVSATAFSTALLWSLVARGARHSGSGGIVLALVAFVQFLASSFIELTPLARAVPLDALRIVHVAMSVVAVSALVLSGLHGALWLTLFREMRKRRFGFLFQRLPDLDVLSRMTRRAALAGFLGLTVGLNVGIGLAHSLKSPGFDYRHPEVLLSLLLWVHFGVVAFSQLIPGLGARRASFAAAGGLVVLLLSLFLMLLPHPFHAGA